MNVIERNFFRLLRSGTFGDDRLVEPLSDWKWRRIYQLSLMHGVAALVYDGIRNHADNFFMKLPQDLDEEWKKTVDTIENTNQKIDSTIASLFGILQEEQVRPILLKGQGLATLYPIPLHRTSGDIDIYLPYAPQAEKADTWAQENGTEQAWANRNILQYRWRDTQIEHHHIPQELTNVFLNRKLQAIIDGEIRCCDSAYVTISDTRIEVVPPTLCLLLIIVRIARYIISEGISLKQIIDLGFFLRTIGDQVDYVKLQDWLKMLKMEYIAQLEGAILIHMFGFAEDEMQFVDHTISEDVKRIRQDIFRLTSNHSDDWYFTQGKNIFVRATNSGAMLWHMRHCARYYRYYPQEAITSFFSSFAHSLSHIEE